MSHPIACPRCARENAPAPAPSLLAGTYACPCGARYTCATPNARDGVQSVVRNLVRTKRLRDEAYLLGAADHQLRRAARGERDEANGWLVARLTETERVRLGLAPV